MALLERAKLFWSDLTFSLRTYTSGQDPHPPMGIALPVIWLFVAEPDDLDS